MIYWQKAGPKSTAGSIITFHLNTTDQQRAGWIHFAEHLMFSGTQKLNRDQLRDTHFKLFNRLEATTSRTAVKLFYYADTADFRETTTIIKDMIENWRCRPTDFSDEKQMVIEEAREYFQSYTYRQRQDLYSALPQKFPEPLGSLSSIKAITPAKLKELKKYWDAQLDAADIDILVISAGISRSDIQHLEQNFPTYTTNVVTNSEETSSLQETKSGVALIKTGATHTYNLFLDRALYWRWYHHKQAQFDYQFVQLDSTSAWHTYSEYKKSPRAAMLNFLTKPITQEEFEFAKTHLLKYFRQCLDTVDLIESLHWLSEFTAGKYGNIKTRDPQQVYKHFEATNYAAFKKFCAGLQ